MKKNGKTNTDIRKFEFFEIIKECSTVPPEEPEEDDPNIPIHLQKSNISINNVSPAGVRQMHAIDGLVFINGKAIHKKEGKMIRESLVMKIYNNKIIDEYRVYNGVYYDFSIKIFEGNPYFVIVGGNFNEYIIEGQKELFMTTFIKIYKATKFIEDKTGRIPVPPGLGPTDEPYPELLVKRIKLLKRLSDNRLVCDTEGDKMEGYESFQNINAFSMNDTFTHAAVSLDKGGILLIYGRPNLLECSTKDMKMIILPIIMVNDREVHITNLEFTTIYIKNELKRLLYASSANSIYYYYWKYDNDKYSMAECKSTVKELNQDGKGSYSGCIDVKGQYLLMGSSSDDYIGEYDNLKFVNLWYFDKKKTIVKYFNDYIMFVIYGEKESSLQIYDRKNQLFVYYEAGPRKITGACYDNDNYVYALFEESPIKKCIVKLKEKKYKDKFEIFFENKLFALAQLYAHNLKLDESNIFEIILKYADYEYSRGNLDKSITEYIKTINYYEPSHVIQKFLDKSKLDYLIKYLEAIVHSMDFKMNDVEEHKNYTTLLLNCYIMKDQFDKLKEFIDKKCQYFSKDLIRTLINTCIEAGNVDTALFIAKQSQSIEEYLMILITKLNKYEEAMNLLEETENNDIVITNHDKIDLYCKLGEYYLKKEEGKEDFSNRFFESVSKFIENNRSVLDRKDIIQLIKIFMDFKQFFKILFEKMETFHLDYEQDIIHKIIELYLEEEDEVDVGINKDKDKNNNKEKLIDMIKDKKYVGKFDEQYVMMLFQNTNFSEGVQVLSELHKYNQELLFIYMDKREYQKIINICLNYGAKNISFWWISLDFFINKESRNKLNEEEINLINKYLDEFLLKFLESGVVLASSILSIINEKNNELSLDVLNNFLNKAIEQETNLIEEQQKKYNKYNSQINDTEKEIKELNTEASVINLNKCSECLMPMNLPFVCFKCGHGFHNSCIGLHSRRHNSNFDDISCLKCKDKKNKIIEELQKNQNIYNNIDKLEKDINNSGDKIDFIHKLYGKGFFHLGPIKDSRIYKEKDQK